MSIALPMAQVSIGECSSENNKLSFTFEIQKNSNEIVENTEKKNFTNEKKSEENITNNSIYNCSLLNSSKTNIFNNNMNEDNLTEIQSNNVSIKSIPTLFEKLCTIDNSSEIINNVPSNDLTELTSETSTTSISKNAVVNYVLKENAQRTQDLIAKQLIEIEKEISRRIQNKNTKQVNY